MQIKLSQVLRDIFIPRYPRLYQHYSPNAAENVALNTTGGYGLISANYQMNVTLTETSIVEVGFNGLFNHSGNINAWRYYMTLIIETTTNKNIARGGSFDYHGTQAAVKTGKYRGTDMTGMIELGAGGPYTFETRVNVAIVNTWQLYQGHMHIKIIRV